MIEIFLQPGEFYVGDADCRIRTLLGSCVSITLWHRERRVGAMSHFLLAERGGAESNELDGRYAEEATVLMLDGLARAHVIPQQCQAKIFGGGDMFPRQSRKDMNNVGRRNGEAARQIMRAHEIPIVAESLYGVGHRNIIFDIKTGHVWSRQVKPLDLSPLAKGSP
jgi:chemotaxis protein CheD